MTEEQAEQMLEILKQILRAIEEMHLDLAKG